MKLLNWLSLLLPISAVVPLGCTNGRISNQFNSPTVVWSRPVRSRAASLRFSPDNSLLLIAGGTSSGTVGRYANGEYIGDYKAKDKRLRLWNVAQRREVERLPAESISGGDMLLMPDFKTLITTWGARKLEVIDVRKRRPDKIIPIRNGYISSMAVSPDGKILAVGMTREVQFRDTRTYKLLKTYRHGGQGTLVNFAANSHIVRCHWGGGMKPHFVDVKTGQRVPTPPSTQPYEVIHSPRGNYWVKVSRRNNLELWKRNGSQSRKLRTWKSTLVKIDTAQFSLDEKILAVGGLSSTETPVQFFDISAVASAFGGG